MQTKCLPAIYLKKMRKDIDLYGHVRQYDWRECDLKFNPIRDNIRAYRSEDREHLFKRCLYYKVDDEYVSKRNQDPCPVTPRVMAESGMVVDVYGRMKERRRNWLAIVYCFYFIYIFAMIWIGATKFKTLEFMFYMMIPLFALLCKTPAHLLFITPSGFRLVKAYLTYNAWWRREHKRRKALIKRNAKRFSLRHPKWWKLEKWERME